MTLRLAPSELERLERHYTGNCMGCERCGAWLRIEAEEPGAVEAYVRYALESEGRRVKLEGEPAP